MGVNYKALAKTAQKLIRDNGRDFSLLRQSAANPAKPWEGSAAPTVEVVQGVFLDQERSMVTGQVVESGRQLVLMPAEGVTSDPQIDDSIDDGGVKYKIQEVLPLRPADTTVFYELQVAR